MSKQLAFKKRIGNGGAVQRYERPRPPRAVLVNLPRNQFLAGAGFTHDQNRTVGLS